jgi:hypothetical protein
MTANVFDPLVANLDRRQLLMRALFGSVGAATALAAFPSEAESSGRRKVVFDLAILGHTFTTILAPGATGTDPTNLFGSTVVAEGALYRGGTIPRGAMNWDLASATPIGHWFIRGFYITRTGRPGEEDRPDPVAIVHSEYVIGRITPDNLFPADQLTSSGLASPTTTRGRNSVVGGTGRYSGARGELFFANIGSNITGVPNFVLDFRLEKLDR